MKMNELEIKIQLESEEHFQIVFNRCQKLFGQPLHVLQLDQYFDTTDRQLKKQDLVVRIRSHGEKQTIALKSPRVNLPSGMTKRIELEFLAAPETNVSEQLHQQGLISFESAEKERWTFLHGNCEIVLDKLPFIGYFMEIEGETEEQIQLIVQELELNSSQVIKKNYGELMQEKFREYNLSVSEMHATFAAEEKFQKS